MLRKLFFAAVTTLGLVTGGRLTAQQGIPLPDPGKPVRVEISAKSDDETYRLIPCGSAGVVLFYKSVETTAEGRIKWYFSLYDQNLQQLWIRSVGLPEGMDFNCSGVLSDTVNLLFRKGGKDKSDKYNIDLLRLSLQQGRFISFPGKIPAESEILDMALSRDRAFIGLNSPGLAASLLVMNLRNGRPVRFLLSEDPASTLNRIQINPFDGKLDAVFVIHYSKNQQELYFSEYDTAGIHLPKALIGTLTAEKDIKKTEFLPLNETSFLVLGTYGPMTSGRKSQKDKTAEETTGFFTTLLEGTLQKSISFYNYLDLKSINNLLGEKELLALKKKAMKKNRSLGDYSIGLQMILHPPVVHGQQIVLLAESCYPEYHTENFTDFDFYGRPFTNSYTIFDGYRYTGGMAAAFDRDGKLLWDNSIEIHNLIAAEAGPRINLTFSGNDAVFSYLSEGKIGSKVIRGFDVVEKTDFSPVMLPLESDKLQAETRSRMVPWYDHYFLCSGFQEIRNINAEGQNKRLVFYFSKIESE
jgi:hypothetical protein